MAALPACITGITALLTTWLPVAAHGDITTDGTMGMAMDLSGPDYAITEDLGTRVGDNLFHSFGRFNIGTGESATFSGTAGTANIIGRVTGGTTSTIDGALNSTIPGASLYLVNPSGVVFGENASINVDGSFHASTADYVRLGNSGRFDAGNPGNSILSQAPPSAFGFLGAPAGIRIERSILKVPQGQTLTLSGGDIELQDAALQAPGGRISLVSTASGGEAVITADGFDTGEFSDMGDITITHTGDYFTRPANLDTSSDSGGIITIQSGRFVMDNGWVFADNFNGAGGRIGIEASDSITLRNEAHVTTDTYGSGNGGEINIDTGDLLLENGGIIQANVAAPFSSGTGGAINVYASGTVLMAGRSPAAGPYSGRELESGFNANTFGPGTGGTINIDSAQLVIADEARIDLNSFGSGDAGMLNLDTQDLQIQSGGSIRTDAFGTGHAGTVRITLDQATLESGGTIAATTHGQGNGGTITITATGIIDISGQDDSGPSGIFTNSFGSGNGGTIQVTADRLTVADGSGIQSAVTGTAATSATRAGDIVIQVTDLAISGQGQISTQSDNAGQAGNIFVHATGQIGITSPDATVQSGLFSTTTGTGNGGNIVLEGASMQMDGGAVNVSSAASGNAGTITLRLGQLNIQDGGQLSTSVSGQGTGGDLLAETGGDIVISGQSGSGFNSGIYSVSLGDGAGGNISLSAGNIELDAGGLVSAESTGTGNAGNIAIRVADSATLNDSSIQTRAVIADGGNIELEAQHLVYLHDSEFTSSVGTGFGNGGNISIDPEFVVLNDSRIIANAYGGTGGNIQITAGNFIASSDSLVDASSQLGIDGTVNIESPNTDPGSGLTELPDTYLNAAALLREPCAARRSINHSSFIIHGQSAIPPGPDAALPLPLPLTAFPAGPGDQDRENSVAIDEVVISGLTGRQAPAHTLTECSP